MPKAQQTRVLLLSYVIVDEFHCLSNGAKIHVLTLQPTGGGGVGPDHQIIDHNSITALSTTSKLGEFLFLSIKHILAEF